MQIKAVAQLVELDCERITKYGRHQACRAFADTIAVCFPGLHEPVYDSLLKYAAGLPDGNVSVPLTTKRLIAKDAALLWGGLSHAIDYDDSCPALCGHPSTVLLSAVIALGCAHGCSGKEALEAYICGFEATNRMAVCCANVQYAKGWHTTTTVGIFGAVVASCRIIGASVEETEHALGIAASMASGIQANFGSSTKPLHPGFAAANAIMAAELAVCGIAASPRAFGDELSYFACYGGEYIEISNARRFIEEGITVKPYPSCGCTTRANDLAIQAYDMGIRPEDISGIECRICTVDENCLSYHRPTSSTEAKFSLEFGIAKCLMNGAVHISDFTDENVRRDMNSEPMKTLVSKIEYTVPEQLKHTPFYEAYMEEIYRLEDGREIHLKEKDGKGFPANPMSDEELHTKFMDCLCGHADDEVCEELYEMLIKIDMQPCLAALVGEIVKIMH